MSIWDRSRGVSLWLGRAESKAKKIANLNSSRVHKSSSSRSGCVGAPGFPLKISSSMSAKSSGCGSSVVCWLITCRILSQVPACCNNVCSLDDFQARTSPRWCLPNWKDFSRTSRLTANRRCWRRWVNMSELPNFHLIWLHLPPMRPAWYNASFSAVIPCSIEFVSSPSTLPNNLRNSTWNSVGWPVSSSCGFECFKRVFVERFSFFAISQTNKQWTQRWSNPMGSALSIQTALVWARMSPITKSNCT